MNIDINVERLFFIIKYVDLNIKTNQKTFYHIFFRCFFVSHFVGWGFCMIGFVPQIDDIFFNIYELWYLD